MKARAQAYENIKTGLTQTARKYAEWIQMVHHYIQCHTFVKTLPLFHKVNENYSNAIQNHGINSTMQVQVSENSLDYLCSTVLNGLNVRMA
jgi:hypothetical protein